MPCAELRRGRSGLSPPAAEFVVHADAEQLEIAIVAVDCIASKRRRARAYRKGLVA